MSASAPHNPSISSDITFITPEPFEPKPLIADILRARFCIPDSIFLVEGVDIAHTSKSKRWRVVRLLLGDGELCIQALLSADMHRFVDRGEIAFGSYVKVQRFRLEFRDVESASGSDDTKQMVYLVVESLLVVGWNNTLADLSMQGQSETDSQSMDVEEDGPREDPQPQSHATKLEHTQSSHMQTVPTHHSKVEEQSEPAGLDDDFEVMAISENKSALNRKEVATSIIENNDVRDSTSINLLPWSTTRPAKLTKLRSIPNLPYKQNWSVNVLCVVSAISDVEPAGIPPYTQRQVRLTDPSTEKHVLLTVFLDPDLFNPQVGSVVLLCGVKNHRFDGGSLKKYASDRPKPGEDWWFENPRHLSWCDVDGLRRWWDENEIQT